MVVPVRSVMRAMVLAVTVVAEPVGTVMARVMATVAMVAVSPAGAMLSVETRVGCARDRADDLDVAVRFRAA